MRKSFLARLIGFVLVGLGRTRYSSLISRLWWVLPVLKITQWLIGRRRQPVRTIHLRRGQEIVVSLKDKQ
jgi:hypothetical protein